MSRSKNYVCRQGSLIPLKENPNHQFQKQPAVIVFYFQIDSLTTHKYKDSISMPWRLQAIAQQLIMEVGGDPIF